MHINQQDSKRGDRDRILKMLGGCGGRAGGPTHREETPPPLKVSPRAPRRVWRPWTAGKRERQQLQVNSVGVLGMALQIAFGWEACGGAGETELRRWRWRR
ncbi:Os09g0463232 [Oryza sativa Japonica Group]|uniref:Os09g0463232 protein n=1 Tax=Oryza sativa subsp. japonica TaxID=39947 RepID=A0A0P0XNN7_ORYSJ|nr:hypothetical protein EE612_048354 [Oryza sativa]BAT08496.1 Os09g0463232 [Oryza sativa Japonica Group]